MLPDGFGEMLDIGMLCIAGLVVKSTYGGSVCGSSRFQCVVEFVGNFVGVDLLQISASTALRRDLGLAGDDAVELFCEFSKQFDVDISSLNVGLIFGTERSASIVGAIVRLVGKGAGDRLKSDVSIRDMVDAVEVGRF